ncbi:LPS export ABC transporter permease LptG [Marinobacterium rhizophilum]|uniref:LPS export ABC transporter permease LptG n=1 Tax=Marinobacterium rhizophilum TaxID=420402 RepID=A0ABY5HH71_9GAMM|nr:LPS export ABC transporter permease LptG [Marinobacterium rhizophilum]UTW11701.1 LPS export ABC transporter permease LptG [Marinobacterium rhizophilum]
MRKLDWYIAQHVLGAIMVVMLVVVGLDLLFALVDELDSLNDRYDMLEALLYLGMTAPRRIYEFLPLSCLVGCLVGLGMLASHSELTVMRASGVSTGRIVGAVMKPVLILVLAALVLGEYVVPKTEQIAQSRRAMVQSGGEALQSRFGVWHREGDSFIHINAVQPDGVIFGVTRYQLDDARDLATASYARRGEFVDNAWQLQDIRETRFLGDRTEVLQRANEVWESGLTPTLLSVIVVEPVDLSISGLKAFSTYLGEQGLSSVDYQLAFWVKLLQPLAILALVLIGISFIFGPLRSVTVGQRLIVGILVGLTFKFAQDLMGPASSVYGFAPWLAVLAPIVLCAALGGWMLQRAK